jgi:rod shape-determining protein MreC
MLFIWLMLAGFIFLFAPQKFANNFQSSFARIFDWPLSISKSVSLSARAKQLPMDVVPRHKYNQLQNHLANVKEWLNETRQKVAKLSGLADRGIWEGEKLVIADVAAVSGSSTELILNRGSDDGVREGQFVLGRESIIGTISVVSSRTSRVKLITDSTSKIAVKIGELEVSRLMQGDGGDLAKIELLGYSKYKVKIGDDVLACKKHGYLNSAMITARVARCKRDDENPSLWDITVKPACDIKRLNDVVVIIINPEQ